MVRPRYACPACQAGIAQAPAPARLIEGGLPAEGAMVQAASEAYDGEIVMIGSSCVRVHQRGAARKKTAAIAA